MAAVAFVVAAAVSTSLLGSVELAWGPCALGGWPLTAEDMRRILARCTHTAGPVLFPEPGAHEPIPPLRQIAF